MYYCLASTKKAVRWEQSYGRMDGLVDKAIGKYSGRGFTFSRADSREPTVRRFNDESALFIDFSDIFRSFIRSSNIVLFDQWVEERRKNVQSIHWLEFDRDIFAMYSPMQVCLRSRPTYAAAACSLPLKQLRRLGDIVALNTSECDELRSKLFRSSVRRTISKNEWGIMEAARSGSVFNALHDANPWSWVL